MSIKKSYFSYLGGLIGLFLIALSIYWFIYSPFQTKDFQSVQDIWMVNIEEDPIGVLFFTFSSRGIIAAKQPVHVKIDFFLSEGRNIEEYLPLSVVIPDSFSYPLIPDQQGVTYSAGIIKLVKSPEGPIDGESDIIFHQSGNFGYLIYSKEQPIYNRLLGQEFFSVVEVAPYSVWFWTNVFDRIFGLSLIEIGLVVEIFAFKRYIQLIPKGQLPNRSRITIYTFCCIIFSSVVYISGTSFFSLNDNNGFTLAVGVGVTLFVGLLRYSI